MLSVILILVTVLQIIGVANDARYDSITGIRRNDGEQNVYRAIQGLYLALFIYLTMLHW